MKIHAELKTASARYMVVETCAPNTGVFSIGERVCLRVVRVPHGTEYKSVKTKGVVQLASREVNTHWRGEFSPYLHSIKVLSESLTSYAANDDK